MEEYKIPVTIKCPYCNVIDIRSFIPNAKESPYSFHLHFGNQFVLCDIEIAGCDKYFVVDLQPERTESENETIVKYKAKVFKLVEGSE